MRKLTKAEIKGVLEGTMLVFDPSSGAKNTATGEKSLAGWSSFDKAKLVESGTISSDNGSTPKRLRSICKVLQSEFSPHDIVVQEKINKHLGHETLIQATGVFIVGTESKQYFEVNITAWQAFARKMGGWVKDDESDAIYMGWYMIAYASGWDSKGTKEHKETMLTFIRRLRDERNYTGLEGKDGSVQEESS